MRMTIATPSCEVTMAFYEYAAPVPNFISWMEALLTDVMHCGFWIEGENHDKYVFARTRWNGRYNLTVSEGDFAGAEEYMKIVVHRRQLIEAVYREFQAFGKSPDYAAEQWALHTLGERLATQIGMSVEDIIDFLKNLDEDSIHKFFHAVLPSNYSGIPSQVKIMRGLQEMVDFALFLKIPSLPSLLFSPHAGRKAAFPNLVKFIS
jgi:hypothetical protein